MRSVLGGMTSVTGMQRLDMGNSFWEILKSDRLMPLWINLTACR